MTPREQMRQLKRYPMRRIGFDPSVPGGLFVLVSKTIDRTLRIRPVFRRLRPGAAACLFLAPAQIGAQRRRQPLPPVRRFS
jgi:hypothetical protein